VLASLKNIRSFECDKQEKMTIVSNPYPNRKLRKKLPNSTWKICSSINKFVWTIPERTTKIV